MAVKENQELSLRERPSKPEAAEFVRSLVRWVGAGFHPDTDFNDYVRGDTNVRSYSLTQAARLNANLDRAVAVLRHGDEDVYDVAAPVQHALLASYFRGNSASC